MKLIEPSIEIVKALEYYEYLDLFEKAARNCYDSESNIVDRDMQRNFIRRCLSKGHDSLLEHLTLTVEMITSRGIMAEITRHRIGIVFHVQSTRFINYKDKDIKFIKPLWYKEAEEMEERGEEHFMIEAAHNWCWHMRECEALYKDLIICGLSPQNARGVLPIDLATRIIFTVNFRELRHVFKLRSIGVTGKPHPEIKLLMDDLLIKCATKFPVFFEDLGNELLKETKDDKN